MSTTEKKSEIAGKLEIVGGIVGGIVEGIVEEVDDNNVKDAEKVKSVGESKEEEKSEEIDLEHKSNWTMPRVDDFHSNIMLNYRFDDNIPHGKRSSIDSINERKKMVFKLHQINDHGEEKLKASLPLSIDMSQKSPAIYSQGSIGSCVAQSICAGIRLRNHKINTDRYKLIQMTSGNKVPEIVPSRLGVYWHARLEAGFASNSDSGATIHAGLLAVEKYKLFDESSWPYDISKFAQEPPINTFVEASQYKEGIKYSKVQNNLLMLKHILSEGFPIACGIVVYESMMSHEVLINGKVPMPKSNESIAGGHAILLVGYNNEDKTFMFQNSWGTIWGKDGFGTLLYEYVTNNGADFWAIERFA